VLEVAVAGAAGDSDDRLEPAHSLTTLAHNGVALEKGRLADGAVRFEWCCCCCLDPTGQVDPLSTPVWGEAGGSAGER
jgi:hypothetical protein